MTSSKTWGGASALYLAASYIFGFALFLGYIDSTNYAGPAGNVAMVVEQATLLSTGIIVLYPLAACALVVLVVALYRQEGNSASAAAQIAALFGSVWAGLLFASGFVSIIGIKTIVPLAVDHPEVAVSTWAAVGIVQNAIGGGIELVGGVWMAMVSWLALKSGSMPRLLAWLGIAVGAVGIATLAPPLTDLADIFGIGQIVWFSWLGIALLRSR